MRRYKYIVFILRSQPFHYGHDYLLKEALNSADNVIVVLGSANGERTLKNPWNCYERQHMISDAQSIEDRVRLIFVYQPDVPGDDDEWANLLRRNIKAATDSVEPSEDIALIGHNHDASSFYLKMFPEWGLIEKENADQFPHATKLREWYFSGNDEWKKFVPENVALFLQDFKNSKHFKDFLYIK